MKKIITYGTFDLLHKGHIRLLKRAKELGDYLIVGLSTDEFNSTMKNKTTAQSYDERKEILEAIRYVDEVIPEKKWEQKINDIIENGVSIFVIGDDWKGKFDYLEKYCKVTYLSRTPGISTTERKNKIVDIFSKKHE